MVDDTSLGAHLRAALGVSVLLALCQIVGETLIVAARVHSFLLSPHTLFGTQMYDFCFKFFLLLPGAERWLIGGRSTVFCQSASPRSSPSVVR